MLLPNLFGTGTMETESFFLFVVWAVLGFVYFRIILKHDNHKRFGKSIIVWIALLSLVLFVSLVWMSRSIMDATDKGLGYVEDYYVASGLSGEVSGIVSSQLSMIRSVSARSIIVVVFVFILSLGILLNNYRTMSKKAEHSELQLWHVQNLAFTDTLTGVKSKLAYTDTENEINDRIASGNSAPFSVVVCDVNGLKHINDTLGHKAGDEYIQKAAKMICGLFVHSPVYRIGGDEFVVILSDSDYLNRSVIVKQLHDMSVENIEKGGAVVSAGISDYEPGVSDSLKSVFEKADTLMYQEKKLLKSMGAATRS
jgi:diguanylate cyclase (GGDEF)-like protein